MIPSHLSFFLVVFSILLINSFAQNKEELVELKFNSQSIQRDLEGNQNEKYFLDISEASNESYLIITAEGTFEGSEPDISISVLETQSNSNVICKSFGFALCYFQRVFFKKHTRIYVKIQCHQSCGFALSAYKQDKTASIIANLNSIQYLIFDDSSGNVADEQVILQRVITVEFDENKMKENNELVGSSELENMLIEMEHMNPDNYFSTFNMYYNFNSQVPTKSQNQGSVLNWGAGSGMGALTFSKKVHKLQSKGTLTITIEAHEGAVIAFRTFGWGKIRKIKPYKLIGGFTYQAAPNMYLQLELDQINAPDWQQHSDLILGLVPFQGDPNIYASTKNFRELESLNDYQWVSDQKLDDRIVISPRDLANSTNLFIRINSPDRFSLFTLRAYFPRGKTPLSFDYPEAGFLEPGEIQSYSLSIFGGQNSTIILALEPRMGKPGLILKRCSILKKEECSIYESDIASAKLPQFEREQLTLQFESYSSECSQDKRDNLSVCYFLIGVANTHQSQPAKYTLKASNGSTHKLLRNEELLYDAVEFGKISYYKLNLKEEEYQKVSQVSFQLSNVQGQVSMFASLGNPKPTVLNKIKQSFYHSLHLYLEEVGSLNTVIYLGVQADSSFATFNIQAKVIDSSELSFYSLSENHPILISEDVTKVKQIKFKFSVQKNFGVAIKIQVHLEPLMGNFEMMIGKHPEIIDQFKSSSNEIEFSTNQAEFESYDQPFYGVVIPKISNHATTILFKLSFTTSRVTHTNLALGIINQIKVYPNKEYYYKIPIHSRETLSIQKNVQCLNNQCHQSSVQVIVSYEQSNVKPKIGDLNSFELSPYSNKQIDDTIFKRYCKQIDEFSVENNCFLFITVISTIEANLLLYADINKEEQLLFSDFPNFLHFKKGEQKKLYFPLIFSSNFNLFKSASLRGSKIVICAKLIDSSLNRKYWDFPVGCKHGNYDFLLSSIEDENYFFEMEGEQEKRICSIANKNCGLTLFLVDHSLQGDIDTDSFSLTLQQQEIQLHSGINHKDSLPANGVRFYFITCLDIKKQKCIVRGTEYHSSSIQLVIYFDNQLLAKSKNGDPQIIIDSNFRQIHSNQLGKSNNNIFKVEVKSLVESTEINYSILFLIEEEVEKTLIPISNGNPVQVQLTQSSDIKYFLYTNRVPRGSFKVSLSQQTQGFTLITIAINTEDIQLPLIDFSIATYENVVVVSEDDLPCNNNNSQCKYIIQLETKQEQGANLSLSISQVETPSEIQLQENISSFNQLQDKEISIYKFNVLKQAELQIIIEYGQLLCQLSRQMINHTQKILNSTIIQSFGGGTNIFFLQPLENINLSYYLKLQAIQESKFYLKLIHEETIQQITFDQPLRDLQMKGLSNSTFQIQNLGDSVINIQLHFTSNKIKADNCKEAISYSFNSDTNESVTSNQINLNFERYSSQCVFHLEIETKSSFKKVYLELKNLQKSEIRNLAIYASSNFELLDFQAPRFFYLDGKSKQYQLFGIILPEKERKVLIEIVSIKGNFKAQGTYSRDSALKGTYEQVFQSAQRKILEVEVKSSHFYVQIKGTEKDTQGFINFVSFPPESELPWNLLKLPNDSRPIARGVFSQPDHEYTDVEFSIDPLKCISQQQREMNEFDLHLVTYSIMLTPDKQLAYTLNEYTPQKPGDFSNIELELSFFKKLINSSNLTSKSLLTFNFEDQPECYESCSSSNSCQSKKISVPLLNKIFSNFTQKNNQIYLIVRSQVTWRHRETNISFTENLYYSEENYNRELIFPLLEQYQDPQNSSFSSLALFIVVLGIIGLFFVAIFYFKKYKITAERLNYELTDVRNVANLSSPDLSPIPSQSKSLDITDQE